ncbi:MAG: hypothetical protein ACHQJ4_05180 [Ignavibacteria bacterium]
MNFKKDYINYVLYNVLHSHGPAYSAHGSGMGYLQLGENPKLKKILDKIINHNDIVKMTFLIGKTAGLELLFKYLLYISDKIDKSQITVFNIRENFEYDVINLKKICEKIEGINTEIQPKIPETSVNEKAEESETKQTKGASTIKIDIRDEKELIEPKQYSTEEPVTEKSLAEEKEEEPEGLTLIENAESVSTENEVFELSNIEETDETIAETTEDEEEAGDESVTDEEGTLESDEETDEETNEETNEETVEEPVTQERGTENNEEVFELEDIESEIDDKNAEEPAETTEEKTLEMEIKSPEPEDETEAFEFEVSSPAAKEGITQQTEPPGEETVTKEAYIKFETRFFEDVKILEKLFAYINKETRLNKTDKLSERMLQSFTEIIEITSELSDLSRQLSFDLTADIFFTINLFFTKAINNPVIISPDKIKLLDSSLVLVNSIIKNEDYMDFNELAEQIEKLKEELTRPSVKKPEPAKKEEPHVEKEPEPVEEVLKEQPVQQIEFDLKENEITPPKPEEKHIEETREEIIEEPVTEPVMEKAYKPTGDEETILFKMKHFVKEFEKIFESIGNIRGEYSKFDALEKIDDMNYCMRMLAKTAAAADLTDLLKLSEVSYVFLKYVKDYRMDMQDSEIRQVIKYIIITFKILIKGKKTEDFNIFVEYLNTPVKIFTDTN